MELAKMDGMRQDRHEEVREKGEGEKHCGTSRTCNTRREFEVRCGSRDPRVNGSIMRTDHLMFLFPHSPF